MSASKKPMGVLAMFGKTKPADDAGAGDPKTNAARGILEAIDSGDAGALASALSTFMEASESAEPGETEPDGDEAA